MEEYLSIISVPAIAAIVYFVINIIKRAVNDSEKFKRFIPLTAAGLGVIFGIVCYYAMPSIIPAENVAVAIVIGGASGLSAAGTNQIVKQLNKKADEKQSSEENPNAETQNVAEKIEKTSKILRPKTIQTKSKTEFVKSLKIKKNFIVAARRKNRLRRSIL